MIDAIEKAIEAIMARLPHMSRDFRESIARNLWWIVAITAGLMVIYAVYLVFGGLLMTSVPGPGVLGLSTTFFVNAVLCAMVAVVGAISVRLLRDMKSQGWRGLFVTWLFLVLIQVVNLIDYFSRSEALWAIFVIAFLAYAIYEPKEFFFIKQKAKPSRAKKPKSANKL